MSVTTVRRSLAGEAAASADVPAQADLACVDVRATGDDAEDAGQVGNEG